MDQKSSVGVAPEMNLKNPLCTGDKTRKRNLIILASKQQPTSPEVITGLKEGYPWPHKKEYCPPKRKENIVKSVSEPKKTKRPNDVDTFQAQKHVTSCLLDFLKQYFPLHLIKNNLRPNLLIPVPVSMS